MIIGTHDVTNQELCSSTQSQSEFIKNDRINLENIHVWLCRRQTLLTKITLIIAHNLQRFY